MFVRKPRLFMDPTRAYIFKLLGIAYSFQASPKKLWKMIIWRIEKINKNW